MSALHEFDLPFEDTSIHCWEGGNGFPILMMHGSGAGASTLGNYKRVMAPLAERFRVLAADLVGFGQSGRRRAAPYFDMEMWLRQAAHLAARFDSESFGMVGHSLSGAIAFKLAGREPRLKAVLTTGTMGASFPCKPGQRGWVYPDSAEQLRQFAESTVFVKSLIDAAEIAHRERILRAPGYREYFSEMFARERQYYIDASALSTEELKAITCPVLMMHGAQDVGFPPELTALVLAKSIPQADVMILGQCAHSVALEYPDKFLAAATQFFGSKG